MPFTVIIAAVAIGAGHLQGGRLLRVRHAGLRWSWLLLAALGIQVGAVVFVMLNVIETGAISVLLVAQGSCSSGWRRTSAARG